MRADALRRREAILAAARAVFAHGPDSGTLEEVARQAGVGIATVYRNFPDKTALLSALLERLLARIIDVQSTTIEQFDHHPEQALRDYAHGLVDLGLAPLIVGTSDTTGHDLLPRFAADSAQLIANNRAIIEQAKAHGLISESVTSRFFIAGLVQAARPAAHTVLPNVPRLEKTMVDVFLKGLRP